MGTANKNRKTRLGGLSTIAPNLRRIISAQREFYQTGRTRDIAFRRQLLINLKIMLRDNEGLIVEALRADLGKSSGESYLTEIGLVDQEINYTLRHLKVWNAPKAVSTPFYLFPSVSYKKRNPRGLVMAFSPWNYPFRLAMMPLISSIAAGNCTILKLSEHAPNTSALLCELIDKYFDREVVATYMDSFEAIKAIGAEQFGLIYYNGGSAVARIVMKAAAAQLTPVVLELGGKSPCIVDKTANLKLAARRIVTGKLINSGQTSVAPDYLFVESCVKEELMTYIKEYHDKFCIDDTADTEAYPKIINRLHFDRLKNYLEDGDVIMGGDTNAETGRISLTLMENIDKKSKLLSEEIFGPILPVFEFDDIGEVISTLRKRPKSIALYLFTRDKQTRRLVLGNLDFGCGCVNDTLVQLANPNLSFGGVGAGGMSRCRGKAGFNAFTSESSILSASSHVDLNPLRYGPFDDEHSLIKTIMRYFT